MLGLSVALAASPGFGVRTGVLFRDGPVSLRSSDGSLVSARGAYFGSGGSLSFAGGSNPYSRIDFPLQCQTIIVSTRPSEALILDPAHCEICL
jgi:hypothetical protein